MKTIKLTQQQYDVIGKVLDEVRDNLNYDKSSAEYREDHEGFMMSLEKGEYLSLVSAAKKF